jgi:hypothetical protein
MVRAPSVTVTAAILLIRVFGQFAPIEASTIPSYVSLKKKTPSKPTAKGRI